MISPIMWHKENKSQYVKCLQSCVSAYLMSEQRLSEDLVWVRLKLRRHNSLLLTQRRAFFLTRQNMCFAALLDQCHSYTHTHTLSLLMFASNSFGLRHSPSVSPVFTMGLFCNHLYSSLFQTLVKVHIKTCYSLLTEHFLCNCFTLFCIIKSVV